MNILTERKIYVFISILSRAKEKCERERGREPVKDKERVGAETDQRETETQRKSDTNRNQQKDSFQNSYVKW